MKEKQRQTEAAIFQAARTVFEREGYSGARMQTIADEAGINKAMLHYYYRSKDQLFFEVFKEGVRRLFPRVLSVLNADLPLEKKLERLADTYHNLLIESSNLPSFVLSEMNYQESLFRDMMADEGIQPPDKFEKQIEKLVQSGEIRQVQPKELMVNLLSLLLFPILMRPMMQSVYSMNDDTYNKFLERRREQIPKMVLESLKIER